MLPGAAVEPGVAEGEDAAVGRHQPVALPVGGGGHADHRFVQRDVARAAVERRVAEGVDAALGVIDPVPPYPTAGLIGEAEPRRTCRLNAAAKAEPVTDTDPLVPFTVNWLTRPPKSPNPLRDVTTSEENVPIDG